MNELATFLKIFLSFIAFYFANIKSGYIFVIQKNNTMKFTITNIIVTHTNERGFCYKITGWVNDHFCKAYTNDSKVLDWYETEAELHQSAKLICETKLMEAYIDGNY